MSQPIKPDYKYSLQTRLVLAFGILLILFLGLAGFALDRAFKESVAAAVEERLQLQINALMGTAEPEGDGFFVPSLEEARFSQINSGLYGFILDEDGFEVWRSYSALDFDPQQRIFLTEMPDPGQTVFGSFETGQQGRMSYASYGTYWASLEKGYAFVVMESVEPTTAEIREFQSNLFLWFGGLAMLLLIAQTLLLRWGLKPLQQLASEVSWIEAGEKDKIEHSYPPELQTLSSNLNLLIKSERERQSRYRVTLGDLAHSLKTPLAVIAGIIHQGRLHKDEHDSQRAGRLDELEEQMERMNQIVSYQLKRATRSGDSGYIGRSVSVSPVIEKILDALEKVYRDKSMIVERNLNASAEFHGEESDLMELCGNILDNAFKYGNTRISIDVSMHSKKLVIVVEDDGNGIAEGDREWVLKRGARADTLKSGQGIGLAVAVDIVSSYKGEIEVAKSALGGARIRIVF